MPFGARSSSETTFGHAFDMIAKTPERVKRNMERDSEFGIKENEKEEDNDSMDMHRTEQTETLVLPDAFLKSKKKPQMVEFVQCESPSQKF